MENKLECVACDLDGSLLNDQKKASELDLKTIKALQEKGIHTFVCSGRPAPFCKQIAYEIGFDSPTINCNGAYVYDFKNNKVLYNVDPIPTEDVLKIYHFAIKHNYPYMIYALENVYFDNPYSKRSLYWMNQLKTVFSKDNAFKIEYFDEKTSHIEDKHVMKIIMPYAPTEALDNFNKEINYDDRFESMFSEKEVIDINNKGITKGFGIKKMSELFNFSLENALVLGDNYNDASMLDIVGYPVVPENGVDELKANARYITTSNNDSPLYHAIKHLFPDLLDF